MVLHGLPTLAEEPLGVAPGISKLPFITGTCSMSGSRTFSGS